MEEREEQMTGTPLNIKDPEAHRLASLIAKETGKSLTRVVLDALKAEFARRGGAVDVEKTRVTLARLHQVPIVDDRNWDEVLYDEKGLPA
jgi:antitoxin VapB